MRNEMEITKILFIKIVRNLIFKVWNYCILSTDEVISWTHNKTLKLLEIKTKRCFQKNEYFIKSCYKRGIVIVSAFFSFVRSDVCTSIQTLGMHDLEPFKIKFLLLFTIFNLFVKGLVNSVNLNQNKKKITSDNSYSSFIILSIFPKNLG